MPKSGNVEKVKNENLVTREGPFLNGTKRRPTRPPYVVVIPTDGTISYTRSVLNTRRLEQPLPRVTYARVLAAGRGNIVSYSIYMQYESVAFFSLR